MFSVSFFFLLVTLGIMMEVLNTYFFTLWKVLVYYLYMFDNVMLKLGIKAGKFKILKNSTVDGIVVFAGKFNVCC